MTKGAFGPIQFPGWLRFQVPTDWNLEEYDDTAISVAVIEFHGRQPHRGSCRGIADKRVRFSVR